MAKKTIKTYNGSGAFTAPAGCTVVQVQATKRANSISIQHTATDGGIVSYMIDPSGNAYGWGINASGELGTGNVTTVSSPTLVVGALTWKQLWVMDNYVQGLATNGNLYGWGANSGGQLGNNGNLAVSSPALVVGGLSFVKVAQFGPFSPVQGMGVTQGGQIWSWGDTTIFGNGVSGGQFFSSPVQVVGGLTWMDFAISGSGSNNGNVQGSVVGITTAGVAYGWGANKNGETGSNTAGGTALSSPVLVVGGLTFAKVYGDTGGSMWGITTSGDMYGWGANATGQLGNGNTTAQSSPTLVVGGLKWKSVWLDNTGGGSQIFALTQAGLAYFWGFNPGGGFSGDGTSGSTNRSSPTAVVGGLRFVKMAVSRSQSVFGLTANGQLYAWGNNNSGQLGQNSITKFSSPVQVVGGLTFADVVTTGAATNNTSVLGLTTQGNLYAWGANLNGQLGISSVAAASSPTLVVGGKLTAVQPTVTTTTVPVVPGQTYQILLQPYFASFGGIAIGNSYLDQVDVIYDS